MGDRVRVTLNVLKVHTDRVIALGEPDEIFEDGDVHNDLSFQDVNYGNLQIEGILMAAGIPYDKTWEAGHGFGAGTSTLRFSDTGQVQLQEYMEVDKGLDASDLYAVVQMPDMTIEQKYGELENKILQHCKDVIPLSWTNQERNAKVYLTRKMVSPKGESHEMA